MKQKREGVKDIKLITKLHRSNLKIKKCAHKNKSLQRKSTDDCVRLVDLIARRVTGRREAKFDGNAGRKRFVERIFSIGKPD
jgi:hypothetical protein